MLVGWNATHTVVVFGILIFALVSIVWASRWEDLIPAVVKWLENNSKKCRSKPPEE